MKRVLAILLAACLLIGMALADEAWYCKKCGTDVTGSVCPTCGGSKETTGLGDGEWVCVCGRVNRSNYCGKCGTSRDDATAAQASGITGYMYEIQAIRNAAVGDHVTYGRYPQTAEGDDETPVEWLVLEVQEDKVLLLSRYGLDAKAYDDEGMGNAVWEECTLRVWLNGAFLDRAFSTEEREAILMTVVDNSKAQGVLGVRGGGNDTKDQLFLLSYAEAKKLFDVTEYNVLNMDSRIAPTAYAKANGAQTMNSYTTEDGSLSGWWWLRSPTGVSLDELLVNTDGSLRSSRKVNKCGLVRPAMWIDIRNDNS